MRGLIVLVLLVLVQQSGQLLASEAGRRNTRNALGVLAIGLLADGKKDVGLIALGATAVAQSKIKENNHRRCRDERNNRHDRYRDSSRYRDNRFSWDNRDEKHENLQAEEARRRFEAERRREDQLRQEEREREKISRNRESYTIRRDENRNGKREGWRSNDRSSYNQRDCRDRLRLVPSRPIAERHEGRYNYSGNRSPFQIRAGYI